MSKTIVTQERNELLDALEAMHWAFATLCERDLAPHVTNRRVARMIAAATQSKHVLARITGHPKYGEAGDGTPARRAWEREYEAAS